MYPKIQTHLGNPGMYPNQCLYSIRLGNTRMYPKIQTHLGNPGIYFKIYIHLGNPGIYPGCLLTTTGGRARPSGDAGKTRHPMSWVLEHAVSTCGWPVRWLSGLAWRERLAQNVEKNRVRVKLNPEHAITKTDFHRKKGDSKAYILRCNTQQFASIFVTYEYFSFLTRGGGSKEYKLLRKSSPCVRSSR